MVDLRDSEGAWAHGGLSAVELAWRSVTAEPKLGALSVVVSTRGVDGWRPKARCTTKVGSGNGIVDARNFTAQTRSRHAVAGGDGGDERSPSPRAGDRSYPVQIGRCC